MLAKMGQTQTSETSELRQAAGAWLKEVREAKGISQRELARALNLDYYTFISQIENGRGRIPQGRYRDWAQALGVEDKVFAKRLLMYYDPVTYEILFSESETGAL